MDMDNHHERGITETDLRDNLLHRSREMDPDVDLGLDRDLEVDPRTRGYNLLHRSREMDPDLDLGLEVDPRNRENNLLPHSTETDPDLDRDRDLETLMARTVINPRSIENHLLPRSRETDPDLDLDLGLEVDMRSRENNLLHRSREIDRERLIVRRGQSFSVTVHRPGPRLHKHQLDLLLLHEGKSDRTEVTVHRQRVDGRSWWFVQHEVQDETLLTVHSPPDAPIGRYSLAVQMTSRGGRVLKTQTATFHLLFNPWCRDDEVYLPDEGQLLEYILNEDGVIFMGSKDHINSLHWSYGQFEDHVMDICFEILDNSNEALQNPQKDRELRGDPVYVCRVISAMMNANGDRGVLSGRWQEPYTGGVSPGHWTGSVSILQQWSRGGARAVKYGQCWVFAAVACTVLRCLGIPTRVITNFNSAHDVDGNLAIDVLYDETLERVDRGRQDSSWNFHCWVESWMKRRDLPHGNDGWQVLDPTPQELSEGRFCCGPCPVAAIKEGNLSVKYDAAFVFAEVNADIVEWIVRSDGQRQKVRVDERSVGKSISTKSVWGDHREDITYSYKYPEGSIEERDVYNKAGQRTPFLNETSGRANLQLFIKHSKPVFGTDFDVIVEVQNDGDIDVNAQLTVLASAVTYNSIHQGECQRQRVFISVRAQTVHREVLRLRYHEYVSCVSENHLIALKAFLEAPGENQPIMKTTNIPLSKPELLVQMSGKAVLLEPLTCIISFTNPLPVALKRGVFTVEGAGLLSAAEVTVRGDIAPGQSVSVSLSFTPVRTGLRKLLVDFDSDRLKDVKGVASVFVRKRHKPFIGRYF